MKTSVVHHSGHSTSILRLYWHFICICSVAQPCLTLCDPMDCSMPGFHVHYQLPEPAQTQVHWLGDAIQPPHPLLSTSPSALNISQHQGLFKWVSSLLQVAKVLEFSFSISPSNEYSGLVSFRMDWLDLLAVQGTLKSLLQHHSSKASVFQHSVGLDSSLNVNIERHECVLRTMFFKLNNVF